MTLHLIRYDLNGMQGFAGCPLCGFSDQNLEYYPTHFENHHSIGKQKWHLSSFNHPKNMAHKFHVVTTEPLE